MLTGAMSQLLSTSSYRKSVHPFPSWSDAILTLELPRAGLET
jgi:hypothetical protein